MDSNATNHTGKNHSHEQMQVQLRVYLKKEQLNLSTIEQIKILQKKQKVKRWHLAINIAAVLFFSYSFLFDITRLGDTLYYILLAVFVINVALILYQQKKIKELIVYLKDEKIT